MQRSRRISWVDQDFQTQIDQSKTYQDQQMNPQRSIFLQTQGISQLDDQNNDNSQLMPCNRPPKKLSEKKYKENISVNTNVEIYNQPKQQRNRKISFMPYLRIQQLEEIREIDESLQGSQKKRSSQWNQNTNQNINQGSLGKEQGVKQFSASKSVQMLKLANTPKSIIKTSVQQQLSNVPKQPSNQDLDFILQDMILKLNKFLHVNQDIEDCQMDSIIETLIALKKKKSYQVEQLQNDLDHLVQIYNPEFQQQDGDEQDELEKEEEEQQNLSSEQLRMQVVNAFGYNVKNIQFRDNHYYLDIHYFKIKLMLHLDIKILSQNGKIGKNQHPFQNSIYQNFMLDLYSKNSQIYDLNVESISLFYSQSRVFDPLNHLNDLLREEKNIYTSHKTLSQIMNSIPIIYLNLGKIEDVIKQCELYFDSKILYDNNAHLLSIYSGYRLKLNNFKSDAAYIIHIDSDMKNQQIKFVELKLLTFQQYEKNLMTFPSQSHDERQNQPSPSRNEELFLDRCLSLQENERIQSKLLNIWQGKSVLDLFQILNQIQEMSLII